MTKICLECIVDPYLQAALRKKARTLKCTFCGNRRRAVEMETLAEEVDTAFRIAYHIGHERPGFYEADDKVYYEQAGDPLLAILQDELGCEFELAVALQTALIDGDPAWIPDGDEPFYDDQLNYERADIFGRELSELWREFAGRLKFRRRFFDNEAVDALRRILGAPGSPEAAELPAARIGEGHPILQLFRARRAVTSEEARGYLNNPAKELGAPPPIAVKPSRMNPAGIAVFYGAVSQEVAVAEVRPAIGSIVVVGSFTITGEQRLLDLTNLGLGSHSGSIFVPDFAERAGRLRFLQGFHYLITQPVQPEEEVLQYLPTQAVAEYVAHVLGFDGILYGSAQTGELDAIFDPGEWAGSVAPAECNVVLFGDPLTGTHSVEYDKGTAKGVWVTSVKYTHSDIRLRGTY